MENEREDLEKLSTLLDEIAAHANAMKHRGTDFVIVDRLSGEFAEPGECIDDFLDDRLDAIHSTTKHRIRELR